MSRILFISKWLLTHSKSLIAPVTILTVVSSLASVLSVFRAILTKGLIDAAVSKTFNTLIWFIFGFFATLLADMIINSIITMMTNYISTKHLNNLQNKLYSHIIFSKWVEQSRYHSGELITRLNNDTASVNSLLINTIPSVITSSIMMVTTFAALIYFDFRLAIIAIILTPTCMAISKIYSSKIRELHISNQENESKYISFMQESLQNTAIIKAFCTEKTSIDTLKKFQENRLKLSLKRSFVSLKSSIILNLSSWAAYSMTFFWGGFGLYSGSMTFGTLSALFQLMDHLSAPFYSLARAYPQIISAASSAERLIQLESLNLEKYESSTLGQMASKAPAGIRFDNVSFSYKQGLPILNGVSFNIEPGLTAGIVGTSGEGKTTLIRLILALIDKDSGKIVLTVNNQPMEAGPFTRNYMSYVPQGNIIFSGSIKDNVLYGNPSATPQDIEMALRVVCAWDFASGLENSLNTWVGEKGLGLSEGQVQRLAIARALLRNKPILILDEATSALDTETERKILNNIRNLKTKPTCIIITHRPAALSICDKVFCLNNGKIEEVYPLSQLYRVGNS